MEYLLLRLDAPLMSFGGVMVDQINPTDRFPGRSLLTGLIGNALGWDHRDRQALQVLQDRIRHASRWDVEPERVIDYHTVDLGQSFMRDTGWTTRGRREDRQGGPASQGTHQRWRHYWANGCATVALALETGGTTTPVQPDLDNVERALRRPARPLFIGRKTCMPAEPIVIGQRIAPTLRAALQKEPLAELQGRRRPERVTGCWPLDEGEGAQPIDADDLRDWHNNVHRGRHQYAVGFLELAP